MPNFFSSIGPFTARTHGAAEFDLPILYYRDDAFALIYTADFDTVKKLMPSERLHPVRLPGGRTAVGIIAYNYIDTSIGPYGEIGIAIPAVYTENAPPPILPLLLESRYPGFGALVLHLPVTTITARDAGRGEWGYTKFIADMNFSITPEFMSCRMTDQDCDILSMRVPRRGIPIRDRNPLVTYSVADNNLIKTVIPQTGAYRFSLSPAEAELRLGNHPVADDLKQLGLAPRPLMSRYYLERYAILPAGEIIETNVHALNGFQGVNRDGAHTVSYVDTD